MRPPPRKNFPSTLPISQPVPSTKFGVLPTPRFVLHHCASHCVCIQRSEGWLPCVHTCGKEKIFLDNSVGQKWRTLLSQRELLYKINDLQKRKEENRAQRSRIVFIRSFRPSYHSVLFGEVVALFFLLSNVLWPFMYEMYRHHLMIRKQIEQSLYIILHTCSLLLMFPKRKEKYQANETHLL